MCWNLHVFIDLATALRIPTFAWAWLNIFTPACLTWNPPSIFWAAEAFQGHWRLLKPIPATVGQGGLHPGQFVFPSESRTSGDSSLCSTRTHLSETQNQLFTGPLTVWENETESDIIIEQDLLSPWTKVSQNSTYSRFIRQREAGAG